MLNRLIVGASAIAALVACGGAVTPDPSQHGAEGSGGPIGPVSTSASTSSGTGFDGTGDYCQGGDYHWGTCGCGAQTYRCCMAGGGVGCGGSGGSSAGPDAGSIVNAWIAYDSSSFDSNRDIYVVRANGMDVRRLTFDPSNDVEPSFSRDGRKLAFASDRVDATMQIYVLDLVTKEVARITARKSGARRPAFSPDGQRIAFRSGGVDDTAEAGVGVSVYTVALDGSDERRIAGTDGSFYAEDNYGGPIYTTDGQGIIYDRYNDVDVVHPDGTGNRIIVPPTTTMQSHPTVSPDGLWVALQVMCGDPAGVASIWVVPSSGIVGWACNTATSHRLSPSFDVIDSRHPAWGPGDQIAWDQGTTDGDIVLWKDGIVSPVTVGPNDDRNPSWAPQGTMIP